MEDTQTLYIPSPYKDSAIALIKNDNIEQFEIEGDEIGTIIRKESNTPIKNEEVEEILSIIGEDYFTTYRLNTSENRSIDDTFIDIREIEYTHGLDKDTLQPLELIPGFTNSYNGYKKKLSDQPERIVIWKDTWIGFTDDGENILYISRDSQNLIKLELVDIYDVYGEGLYQYLLESNIFNELTINFEKGIKDKLDFLNSFVNIFTNQSDSIGNPPNFGDIDFDYQGIVNKVNDFQPSLNLKVEELELVTEMAKENWKGSLDGLVEEFSNDPKMQALLAVVKPLLELRQKKSDN